MANDILFAGAIAAIEHDSDALVFVNDVFGDVRELRKDGTDNIANGKIGTPISALKWGSSGARVYYLDAHNNVREVCQDGKGWYDGNLSQGKHIAAPYSSISSVTIFEHEIRVYAQLPNNTIQEFMWHNSKWAEGTNLGHALPGTSIAATSWANKHIRVYFQDGDLNVIEKAWDEGGWYTGNLRFSSNVTRVNLGVTSWGDGKNLGIRLYYATSDNTLKEKAWDGGGGWYDGGFKHECVPGSRVAATPSPKLRVYFQSGAMKSAALTEMVWSNGWHASKDSLPRAV
ncbi:hypothetical protein CDD81_1641 [Ophiocordyceps australis]|uniref:Uncharacterized protein n=1 Tax=Ophiocordyceps australis TaxID=1399860 RepID=A0A2C5XYG1_9HYPO|nr:hypothetical protein CDD81_1641 [Ophiocordyceps australis]